MNNKDIEELEAQIAQIMRAFEEMLEIMRERIESAIEAFNDAGLLDN